MKRALATLVLAAVNVAVYATESLAFLWPVMALVDVGAVLTMRSRVRVR
jgi:hypothetical protein